MSKELVISATRHETRVATLEDDQLVEIAIERASEHALAGNIYKGRVSRVLPGMQSAFVKLGLERDAFLYVSDVLDETAEHESGALDDDEDALLADAKTSSPSTESADADAEPARERGRRGRRDRRGRGRGDRNDRGDRSDRNDRSGDSGDQSEGEDRAELESAPREEKPEGDDDGQKRERRGRRGRRRRGRGGRDGREGGSREGGRFPQEKFAAIEGSEGVEETPRRREASEDESEARVAKRAREVDPRDEDDGDEFEVLPGESLAKYGGRAFVEDEEIEYEEEEGDEPEASDEDDEIEIEIEGEDEAEEEDDDSEDDEEAVDHEDESEIEAEEEIEADLEPEELEAAAEAVSEEAEEAKDAEAEAEEEAEEDEESLADDSDEDGEGESEEEPRAGESAEVRERSNSRYLRRGRRGRRRGGRGRRDRAEASGEAPEQAEERTEEEAPERKPAKPEPERAAVVEERDVSISDLLKPGQEVIVQVAKEPLGKKGARITAHVALPGRHLVYMPTVAHVGVSRKIGSDAERARLRRVIKEASVGIPGGFIVRTAGQGASDEELQEDIRFLANLWKSIKEKAEKRPAPTLLHQDLDVVERFLRDQLGQNFKTIWVDSEDHYERIVQFVERFQPDLLERVKLYTRSKPIFDEFKITTELEKAMRPKVWLKSGGYIVINQTEALVAIDVNTGKYVGKSDRLEDTIVKTNLEAVQEVVRQMRLRDLGGIIVVDFIDMDDRSNRKKVAQALEKELRLDRAPSKALSFNDFGLVAITRKRVKQSLERTLCSPCPTCDGSGYVKSPTTVILEILSEARKLRSKVKEDAKETKDVILRVNPDVARVLKSRDNTYLQEIEEFLKANVLVRGDLSLHRENFDFNI
ncbi:MAG: Rne/Rng family ribonuclease [Bryobacterales bacterium]